MKTTDDGSTPLQHNVFVPGDLYYQQEPAVWNGRLQPIISTWSYLGKQALHTELPPEGPEGYVFGLVPYLSQKTSQTSQVFASNVTQTIWSIEDARRRMQPWPTFARSLLPPSECDDLPRRPCERAGMDRLLPDHENTYQTSVFAPLSEAHHNGPQPPKESFYYTVIPNAQKLMRSRVFEIICLTTLRNDTPKNQQRTARKAQRRREHTQKLSVIFSRGTGLEWWGTPLTYTGHIPNDMFSNWDTCWLRVLYNIGLSATEKVHELDYLFYSFVFNAMKRGEMLALAHHLRSLPRDADLETAMSHYILRFARENDIHFD